MSAQKKEKSKAKKQLKAIILKSLRQISSCGYCKFKLCAVDYTVAKRLSQQHFRISSCISEKRGSLSSNTIQIESRHFITGHFSSQQHSVLNTSFQHQTSSYQSEADVHANVFFCYYMSTMLTKAKFI